MAVVDEPARGRLQADRAGRDREVTQAHLGLERPARADADERGSLRDREDLGDGDLDIVRPDAGGDDRDWQSLVGTGGRGELSVAMLAIDPVEALRDLRRSILVAGEEDV